MYYFTLTLKFVLYTLARIAVIFSHLFVGNRISSLAIEIYSYCKIRAWLYFNKEHNIVILLSGKQVFAESTWPLFSGTKCYMIMLLYDMKFRITSFDMIQSSPCVLFFPMYFLALSQKTEANFQILKFRLLASQSYYHIFCYEKFVIG